MKGEHYATATMGFCIHRYNFQRILGWQVLFPTQMRFVGFAHPQPLRQNPVGKRHLRDLGRTLAPRGCSIEV